MTTLLLIMGIIILTPMAIVAVLLTIALVSVILPAKRSW